MPKCIWFVALGVASCSAPTKGKLAPEPQPAGGGALAIDGDRFTLKLVRVDDAPLWMGGTFEVTVAGGLQGEPLAVASSIKRPGALTCGARLTQACFDLGGELDWVQTVTAGVDGRARATISLPVQTPRTVYLQASRLDGSGRVSEIVKVRGMPFRLDSDGDQAFDAVEVMLGLDPGNPDSDGDGVRDGDDPEPLVPGTVLDVFVAEDVVVSLPEEPLVDPEFSVIDGRFVWQTRRGEELWSGTIDLETGAFVPPNGRGELITAGVAELDLGYNGAEWSESAEGSFVVFTRPLSGDDWAVEYARRDAEGVWTTAQVPGDARGAVPFGHVALDRDRSLLTYWTRSRSDMVIAWREVLGESVNKLPANLSRNDTRLVRDAGLIVGTTEDEGNQRQLFVYDTVSDTWEFVTSDPTNKYEPQGWYAPDLGGIALLAERGTVFKKSVEVVVWRQEGAGWVEHAVIRPPPRFPFPLMPRAFVWEGRSYIYFAASQGNDPRQILPTAMYIAGLDPDAPLLRRVDDGRPRNRKDPEVVTVGARPWLYYSEAYDAVRTVRRCELGLPPKGSRTPTDTGGSDGADSDGSDSAVR